MERVLRCIKCGKEYSLDDVRYRCDCGGLLEVTQEELPEPQIASVWDSRLASKKAVDQSGVWRYREMVLDEENPVTFPEGKTNLYPVSMRKGLFAKHEGENPTGSFKDRGMTAGITFALSLIHI